MQAKKLFIFPFVFIFTFIVPVLFSLQLTSLNDYEIHTYRYTYIHICIYYSVLPHRCPHFTHFNQPCTETHTFTKHTRYDNNCIILLNHLWFISVPCVAVVVFWFNYNNNISILIIIQSSSSCLLCHQLQLL